MQLGGGAALPGVPCYHSTTAEHFVRWRQKGLGNKRCTIFNTGNIMPWCRYEQMANLSQIVSLKHSSERCRKVVFVLCDSLVTNSSALKCYFVAVQSFQSFSLSYISRWSLHLSGWKCSSFSCPVHFSRCSNHSSNIFITNFTCWWRLQDINECSWTPA